MQRTIILYESRYGTTEVIAKNLSLILGPSKYCKIEDFKKSDKDFEFFVIGSPVYNEKIQLKTLKFLEDNIEWIKDKRIAVFCTCISTKKEYEYINKLLGILDNSVVYFRALGGIIQLDKLNSEDYRAIELFCNKVTMPFVDINMYDINKVIEFGIDVKNIRDEFIKRVPGTQLLKGIEEFLNAHNTCTLCTASSIGVRGTPIEYSYKDGYIYIITEGGEKFANILLNNKVSISIYDNYQSMMKLGGMQITGEASIIYSNTDEYKKILYLKEINPDSIGDFSVNMNIIKIKMRKVEFLYSKFKNMGYDIKQIYLFN